MYNTIMNMFKPTGAKDPDDYLAQIAEPRKSEVVALDKLIRKTLPKLDRKLYYGIIGYGGMRYKTKSGLEGEWFKVGLASQKNYISLYICAVDKNEHDYLAEKHKDWFPKASIGRSCIRFKKLEDVDLDNVVKILKEAETATPAQ